MRLTNYSIPQNITSNSDNPAWNCENISKVALCTVTQKTRPDHQRPRIWLRCLCVLRPLELANAQTGRPEHLCKSRKKKMEGGKTGKQLPSPDRVQWNNILWPSLESDGLSIPSRNLVWNRQISRHIKLGTLQHRYRKSYLPGDPKTSTQKYLQSFLTLHRLHHHTVTKDMTNTFIHLHITIYLIKHIYTSPHHHLSHQTHLHISYTSGLIKQDSLKYVECLQRTLLRGEWRYW